MTVPDVWLPGAYVDRGRNAGYNSGRSDMRAAVAHYTVGADSRNVGRDGYFHFLVHRDASRENGITQYCEVDAISWHAADANPWGPGVEWERMVTGGVNDEGLSEAEPLTENQIAWGSRLVDFFAEWGIPAQLYDGPRYEAGGWFGWVNHQAIDSQRSDGLLRAEFDLLAGGAPVTEPERPDMDPNEHAWLERLHEQLINQPFFLQAHYNGTDWTQNLHEQLVNQPFFLDAHYATAADVADLETKIDAILDQLGIVVPASRSEPERAEPVESSSAPPESRD